MSLPREPNYFVEKVRALHLAMRDGLLAQVRAQASEALSAVADVRGGDTIYQIDAHADEILHEFCSEWVKEIGPLVLISEGIEGAGWQVFPEGTSESDASFLMIVDPIDGTRNIMYDKRSAWILTGIAPNRGRETNLAHIEAAVMTELPTTRHRVGDVLWATVGGGAHRETQDLSTGESHAVPLRPSQSSNLAHGFASIAKFFPPAKAAIAAFEEELLARAMPGDAGENPLVFDDQYISTGGQLYELLVGHDRFLADLRPVFFEKLGLPKKLVCHPYDICVELIAREAGVFVTDETGQPLSAPLDIRADVSWCGYANQQLKETIEPVLLELLRKL
jgi:fructose-1,6-bisphosphatase/inositol monophosphatase family enzyme